MCQVQKPPPGRFGVTTGSTVRTPYSRLSGEHCDHIIQAFYLSLTIVVANLFCIMGIDISGAYFDVASWTDFWEIGVQLNGMCIGKGR